MGERSGGKPEDEASSPRAGRTRRGRTSDGRQDTAGSKTEVAWPAPELADAALEAALELVPFPAFLVGPDGRVLHANAAGRALREREPRQVVAALERAVAGERAVSFDVLPVRAAGAPTHWLAVRREAVASAADRVRAAARRWRLTRRQGEVLAEVARGRSNREIAGTLGCAESTVELHVTAVLEKAGCQGRSELVARFWTEV